jgi:hypothetical protein
MDRQLARLRPEEVPGTCTEIANIQHLVKRELFFSNALFLNEDLDLARPVTQL